VLCKQGVAGSIPVRSKDLRKWLACRWHGWAAKRERRTLDGLVDDREGKGRRGASLSNRKFRQMREMGLGEPVDLGLQEVFVGAFHYVPDGPRVFVTWGAGEPSPCIILRASHALAIADGLVRFIDRSSLPLSVLEERAGAHGAWVELRRAYGGYAVTLTAFGDRSRVNSPEGVTLDIPLGAVPQFAHALRASLKRIEDDV